jgi:rubrerythrin
MLIPSASTAVRKAPKMVRACSNHAPSQSGLEKSQVILRSMAQHKRRTDMYITSLREFRKDDELLVCTQCGTQHGAKAGGLTDCHICDV